MYLVESSLFIRIILFHPRGMLYLSAILNGKLRVHRLCVLVATLAHAKLQGSERAMGCSGSDVTNQSGELEDRN